MAAPTDTAAGAGASSKLVINVPGGLVVDTKTSGRRSALASRGSTRSVITTPRGTFMAPAKTVAPRVAKPVGSVDTGSRVAKPALPPGKGPAKAPTQPRKAKKGKKRRKSKRRRKSKSKRAGVEWTVLEPAIPRVPTPPAVEYVETRPQWPVEAPRERPFHFGIGLFEGERKHAAQERHRERMSRKRAKAREEERRRQELTQKYGTVPNRPAVGFNLPGDWHKKSREQPKGRGAAFYEQRSANNTWEVRPSCGGLLCACGGLCWCTDVRLVCQNYFGVNTHEIEQVARAGGGVDATTLLRQHSERRVAAGMGSAGGGGKLSLHERLAQAAAAMEAYVDVRMAGGCSCARVWCCMTVVVCGCSWSGPQVALDKSSNFFATLKDGLGSEHTEAAHVDGDGGAAQGEDQQGGTPRPSLADLLRRATTARNVLDRLVNQQPPAVGAATAHSPASASGGGGGLAATNAESESQAALRRNLQDAGLDAADLAPLFDDFVEMLSLHQRQMEVRQKDGPESPSHSKDVLAVTQAATSLLMDVERAGLDMVATADDPDGLKPPVRTFRRDDVTTSVGITTAPPPRRHRSQQSPGHRQPSALEGSQPSEPQHHHHHAKRLLVVRLDEDGDPILQMEEQLSDSSDDGAPGGGGGASVSTASRTRRSTATSRSSSTTRRRRRRTGHISSYEGLFSAAAAAEAARGGSLDSSPARTPQHRRGGRGSFRKKASRSRRSSGSNDAPHVVTASGETVKPGVAAGKPKRSPRHLRRGHSKPSKAMRMIADVKQKSHNWKTKMSDSFREAKQQAAQVDVDSEPTPVEGDDTSNSRSRKRRDTISSWPNDPPTSVLGDETRQLDLTDDELEASSTSRGRPQQRQPVSRSRPGSRTEGASAINRASRPRRRSISVTRPSARPSRSPSASPRGKQPRRRRRRSAGRRGSVSRSKSRSRRRSSGTSRRSSSSSQGSWSSGGLQAGGGTAALVSSPAKAAQAHVSRGKVVVPINEPPKLLAAEPAKFRVLSPPPASPQHGTASSESPERVRRPLGTGVSRQQGEAGGDGGREGLDGSSSPATSVIVVVGSSPATTMGGGSDAAPSQLATSGGVGTGTLLRGSPVRKSSRHTVGGAGAAGGGGVDVHALTQSLSSRSLEAKDSSTAAAPLPSHAKQVAAAQTGSELRVQGTVPAAEDPSRVRVGKDGTTVVDRSDDRYAGSDVEDAFHAEALEQALLDESQSLASEVEAKATQKLLSVSSNGDDGDLETEAGWKDVDSVFTAIPPSIMTDQGSGYQSPSPQHGGMAGDTASLGIRGVGASPPSRSPSAMVRQGNMNCTQHHGNPPSKTNVVPAAKRVSALHQLGIASRALLAPARLARAVIRKRKQRAQAGATAPSPTAGGVLGLRQRLQQQRAEEAYQQRLAAEAAQHEQAARREGSGVGGDGDGDGGVDGVGDDDKATTNPASVGAASGVPQPSPLPHVAGGSQAPASPRRDSLGTLMRHGSKRMLSVTKYGTDGGSAGSGDGEPTGGDGLLHVGGVPSQAVGGAGAEEDAKQVARAAGGKLGRGRLYTHSRRAAQAADHSSSSHSLLGPLLPSPPPHSSSSHSNCSNGNSDGNNVNGDGSSGKGAQPAGDTPLAAGAGTKVVAGRAVYKNKATAQPERRWSVEPLRASSTSKPGTVLASSVVHRHVNSPLSSGVPITPIDTNPPTRKGSVDGGSHASVLPPQSVSSPTHALVMLTHSPTNRYGHAAGGRLSDADRARVAEAHNRALHGDAASGSKQPSVAVWTPVVLSTGGVRSVAGVECAASNCQWLIFGVRVAVWL